MVNKNSSSLPPSESAPYASEHVCYLAVPDIVSLRVSSGSVQALMFLYSAVYPNPEKNVGAFKRTCSFVVMLSHSAMS